MSENSIENGKSEERHETEDILGIFYSKFGDSDPEIQVCFPVSLNKNFAFEVFMRSIRAFSNKVEDLSGKHSALPFTEYKLQVVTYYFKEPADPPQDYRMASITILIKDILSNYICDNITYFKKWFQELADKLIQKKNLQQLFLSEFYFDLLELIKRHKTIEMITEETIQIEETNKRCVLLSYFHTKLGPIPIYCYPENILDDQTQMKISKELEMNIEKGFFTRTYPDLVAIHYYFELPSLRARGNVELCLISFIFDKMPPKRIIDNISLNLSNMMELLNKKEEIYLAFYKGRHIKDKLDRIEAMYEFLKQWVQTIYNQFVKFKNLERNGAFPFK